ncbi:MAG: hypothetical protein A2017_11340 [Lentisphaerae bacterium GWF2_44_16]|nr:MAG: hypothetical protein A2017_11340 [Lentisphaerae bacterium GWF2_44_16]
MIRIVLLLILSAVCFRLGAEDNKALPMISKVLNLYLEDKAGEAQWEAMENIKKAEEKGASKTEILLLKYLGNASDAKEWNIYFAAEKSPSLVPFISLCIFVRKAAMEKELDALDLEICVNNYLADAKAFKSKETDIWNPKAELWKKWAAGNMKYVDGLPPLLNRKSRKFETSGTAVKPSVAVDFYNMSLSDFKQSRKPFSARPRPAGMDFDPKALQKYIDTLPSKELKVAEARRCNYLNKTKKYIIRLLERSPYTGEIKLKNASIKGTVTMANENVLRISNGNSQKNKNCKWDDLAFEQYINFFNFYGNQRAEISGGSVSREESKHFAAEDFLLLAVLCDWYGRYDDAIKYLKRAIDLSPKIKDEAYSIIAAF